MSLRQVRTPGRASRGQRRRPAGHRPSTHPKHSTASMYGCRSPPGRPFDRLYPLGETSYRARTSGQRADQLKREAGDEQSDGEV